MNAASIDVAARRLALALGVAAGAGLVAYLAVAGLAGRAAEIADRISNR